MRTLRSESYGPQTTVSWLDRFVSWSLMNVNWMCTYQMMTKFRELLERARNLFEIWRISFCFDLSALSTAPDDEQENSLWSDWIGWNTGTMWSWWSLTPSEFHRCIENIFVQGQKWTFFWSSSSIARSRLFLTQKLQISCTNRWSYQTSRNCPVIENKNSIAWSRFVCDVELKVSILTPSVVATLFMTHGMNTNLRPKNANCSNFISIEIE
jgi:hypothetical protein